MASWEIKGMGVRRCTKINLETLADDVRKAGQFGETQPEIAKKMGISERYLLLLAKKYPDVREALDMARTNGAAYISEHLRTNMGDKEYNPAIGFFLLTKQHKWTDRPYPEDEEEKKSVLTEEEQDALNRIKETVDALKKECERDY